MKKTWGPHNLTPEKRGRRGTYQDGVSDRERILAQGLVGGLSKAAAFRKAGYAAGCAQEDILSRPRLVQYIHALRDRAVTRMDYSIDNLCARLEHIACAALEDRQYAPAVTAVMGIAKMVGHLADRSEIEMHIISKPAREPTKEITLTPEEWQRQFAPKQIQ